VELSGSELADDLLVTFFDLTQRRAIEEALLHEQEFTRALLENLSAGVVACDATGKLRLFNRAAREWHGLGPAEVSQDQWANLYDLFEADGETRMTAETVPLARALRQKNVKAAHMVIAAAGQPPRHILANAAQVKTTEGVSLGAVAVMLDVTEQRATQAQMQLQVAALNAAANAIVITDQSGQIVWANAAFSRHTGYSLAEALGQTPRLLKSGVQSDDFYREMWATVAQGKVWHGELKNRRKDGTIFDEEMTITPLWSAVGKVTHFIAIKQDITERRSLEQQYLRAQRMEGLGLLAGGIAHDLNNVLTPILMSAEILQWSELPPDLHRLVKTIETSAKRGAGIVKQVLTFARGMDGEKVPLQLRHLIKEMAALVSETFPRNIELKTRLAGGLRLVRGDASQLHQVLLNLSVNARDSMPLGGELVFSASNEHLDESTARALANLAAGDYVRLEVSDTGTGIPPEIVNRIFDPFFTTKEQGKGTGLGLSTVVGILRGHAGAVSVDSTPGQGTRFTIFLPALPADEVEDARQQKRPQLPQGKNELVLLVDDEPGILEVGETLLKSSGYRVLTAANGVDALLTFAQNQADVAVVITDIMMPIMDGVTLVSQLQRIKPGTRCLAASGLIEGGDPERIEKLKSYGVTQFLTKPFTAETLLEALDQTLH
jgi:PAS domain S-box-containing protein